MEERGAFSLMYFCVQADAPVESTSDIVEPSWNNEEEIFSVPNRAHAMRFAIRDIINENESAPIWSAPVPLRAQHVHVIGAGSSTLLVEVAERRGSLGKFCCVS